jgi:hypothetical protein
MGACAENFSGNYNQSKLYPPVDRQQLPAFFTSRSIFGSAALEGRVCGSGGEGRGGVFVVRNAVGKEGRRREGWGV